MWLNLTNIILRKKSQVQTVQTLWFLLCEVKKQKTKKKKQKKKKGKLLKTRTALIVLSLGKVWLETSRELNCIPERNAHVLTPTLVNVSLFGNGVSGDLTKDHKMRSSWIVCICISHFSCVQFFLTLWTVVHQAPLSMGFSRQEHWSGLPFTLPGDASQHKITLCLIFPNTGSNQHPLCLLLWQAVSLPPAPPGKPHPGLGWP